MKKREPDLHTIMLGWNRERMEQDVLVYVNNGQRRIAILDHTRVSRA